MGGAARLLARREQTSRDHSRLRPAAPRQPCQEEAWRASPARLDNTIPRVSPQSPLQASNSNGGVNARAFDRFVSRRSNLANREAGELHARCSASAKSSSLSNASNASSAARTGSRFSSVMCSMLVSTPPGKCPSRATHGTRTGQLAEPRRRLTAAWRAGHRSLRPPWGDARYPARDGGAKRLVLAPEGLLERGLLVHHDLDVEGEPQNRAVDD